MVADFWTADYQCIVSYLLVRWLVDRDTFSNVTWQGSFSPRRPWTVCWPVPLSWSRFGHTHHKTLFHLRELCLIGLGGKVCAGVLSTLPGLSPLIRGGGLAPAYEVRALGAFLPPGYCTSYRTYSKWSTEPATQQPATFLLRTPHYDNLCPPHSFRGVALRRRF